MQWRSAITSRLRRLLRRIKQSLSPAVLDEASILMALRSLPESPRPMIIVHSSLSACGKVRGGAPAVVRALRKWMKEGTLTMPTHTYCYPDPSGKVPVFDPASSSSHVGTITNSFWREPDVLRSLHPTHSLAACGRAARQLIEGHEFTDTPCGAGTPYEKLVNADAGILMFGVTLNSCTLLHTAEAEAAVPYLYSPHPVSLQMRGPDSSIRPMKMRRQDMSVARRFAEMDTWLEQQGLLHRIPCGSGQLLWLPHSRDVHRTLVAALKADPWMLVAPSARPSHAAA